jgi:Tfp pilus assembly protein PilO
VIVDKQAERKEMGLQHAIDGIHPEPEDVAPVEGDGGTPTRSNALNEKMKGMLGHLSSRFPRRLNDVVKGRHAVWKVAILSVLLYFATFNLSYFFIMKPVWQRLDGLVAKKAIIQDFLIVRESGSAITAFRDGLMRGDERVTVISELEQMATRAGLRLAGRPGLPGSREVSQRMTEYPIELRLRGSYHEVGEFLGLVESSHRFLMVREVELDTRDTSSREGEAKIVVGAISWEE